MVSQEEYNLLLILQSNPTISYSEIAKILNYSPATAKRKITDLRQKGLYSGKYAQYQPTALGLTKFVSLLFVDEPHKLNIVEKALREHPYTIHRSRIYAPKLGLYAEFDFPLKEPTLLARFFDELEQRKILCSYELYSSTNIEQSLSLNLEMISLSNLEWSFDWQSFKTKFNENKSNSLPHPAVNVLSIMKPIDFKILRILSNDADASQRQISLKLKADRTEIWRRIKFLEEKVLSGYKSKIDRRCFNITSNKIIFLDFKDEKQLWQFFNAFSNEDIRPPFRYRLEVLSDNNARKILLMYISLSQHHEAQLFYFINEYASIKSFDIDSAGKHGIRYSLYDPNYDLQSENWIVSEEYLVIEPLRRL
ncbi:MAG: winged helix-turn-helix transcriptional regulator [Candidatus Heimdallarchaeota archaeon]|nr:winged helix-turn-helix transcriptional regulator [Candidatus Heimdallarchaeota archaeon]